ncbi:MAG: YceI family protein [Acetobacteraceae bacterium]
MRPTVPLLAALLALTPPPAVGATRTVHLAPPDATLTIRAYMIGLLPITARFTRFEATLTYDPAMPARCAATLTAFTNSLESANARAREAILGPDFLDAARFPTLTFTGMCAAAGALGGTLTLRGVARPLAMRLDWTVDGVAAEGDMHRALWGMTAKPFLVGPTIRLDLTARLS